jgi:hypothetical protein
MAGRVLDADFFARLQTASDARPNVTLLNALDHAAAMALLHEADVLISPSRDETMPIVILEAMGAGKAVITTDVGGVREWIHDELNGLVVPPENPEALAAAVARCGKDRELVEQLGAASRRTFDRHFALDRFATRFAELIELVRAGKFQRRPASSISYQEWIAQFDAATRGGALILRRQVRAMLRQPVISVVLPVYNPDLSILAAAIESVEHQTYQHWELCIADDASTNPDVRPFLEAKARAGLASSWSFGRRTAHLCVFEFRHRVGYRPMVRCSIRTMLWRQTRSLSCARNRTVSRCWLVLFRRRQDRCHGPALKSIL